MADVIHPTTLKYLKSVNTPEYPPPWVVNPDMSQVLGILPPQHWKWDTPANRPVPMTAGEIAAYEAGVLDAQADAEVAPLSDANLPDLLRALALVVMDEVNNLRALHGSAPRTVSQLKAALKAKMT